MSPFDQNRYIREIKFQCYLAIRAASDYDSAYQIWSSQPFSAEGYRMIFQLNHPSTEEERNRINGAACDIFRHVHSLLAHVSNISKIFWPIATQRQNESQQVFEIRMPRVKRGRELRELYNIPEINALLDRSLRDNLEHFDERMDAYFQQYPGSIIDIIIGSEDILTEPDRNSILRHAIEDKFFFRGVEYDLSTMMLNIHRIYDRSQELLPNT